MSANRLGTMKGAFGLVLGTVAALGLMSYGVTSEVPVGSVSGKVLMKPDNKALPGAEVVVYPEFEVPEGSRASWSTKTDQDGAFRFRNLPAGKFRIQAWGKAHSMKGPDQLVVAEGKSLTKDLPLDRSNPELTVYGNQRVYTPDERPEITVNGFTTVDSLDLTVFSVPIEALRSQPNLDSLFSSIAYNRIRKDPESTAGLKLWKTSSQPLRRKDIEGVFAEQVAFSPMPEGIYLVKVKAGDTQRYTWMTVSRIALVTKTTDSQAVAYVVDLKSGQPLPGAEVQALGDNMAKPLGKTGPDGTLQVANWATTAASGLLATHEGSMALSWFYRVGDRGTGYTVWTQTDRPIYRPGDQVRFRTIVRQPTEGGYRTPAGTNATVAVFDPEDTPVSTRYATLDDFGATHGEFKIDNTVMPGSYQIRVTCGDTTETAYVNVASYRKPEFRVVVDPAQKVFVRGDAVAFTVRAEYFTGEPVAGADVTAMLSRSQIYRWTPFDDADPEEDEAFWGGDPVKEFTGRTDGDGRATFTLPSVQIPDPDRGLFDLRLELSASVTDQGGRAFTGSGRADLVRGEFSIETEFDRFVADPGQSATLTIRGKNLATGRPEAGRQVTFVTERERYSGNRVVRVETGRRTVTLDESGEARVSVSSDEPGSLRTVVSASDGRGNSVRSEGYLWVYAGGADFGTRTPGLQLVLDKATYAPGEKAVAIVRTDRPGGSAWVTLEDERIRWSKVVPLEGLATRIEVENLGQYAPNVLMRVVYVKDKEFREAGRSLRVDLAEKKLEVKVQPDRPTAKPGETVIYTVEARDGQGRPVQAQVALGVVDEGVYSIAEDRDDPLRVFYPRKWSSVSTNHSFPTIYLDGEDKTPASVEVRRKFEDTAFWKADVRTGEDGKAKVTVSLPDNITEWRATATAFTRDTRIGRARAGLIAQKDLMVRLATPSFLTGSDKIALVGRVSNTTDRELSVTARLDLTGATLDGSPTQNLRIGPKSTADVKWNATAGTVGTAKLKLTAWTPDNGPSDGLEVSVPVEVRGRWSVATKVGEATGTTALDWEADPKAVDGALKVTISSSLIGPLVASLPGLIDFPYGCAEQTTSRFVPAVLVGRLVEGMGLVPPAATARIPQVTRDSLTRLKMLQNGAGWGWWEFDKPNPWMTAYVLEGLGAVQEAGVAVSGSMTGRAREWALEWLEKEKIPQMPNGPRVKPEDLFVPSSPGQVSPVNLDEAVYLAAVVARQGPAKASEKWLAAGEEWKDVSTLSLAQVALARLAQRSRGESGGSRADAVYQALLKRADETESTLEWPQEGWSEPSAAGLQAVVAFEPDSPRVMKAVRSLMAARRGQMWSSTRDTARVLMGLVNAAGRFPAPATGEVSVRIDGREVASVKLGVDTAGVPKTVTVPWKDLPKGRFKLEIVPSGDGAFPYSAEYRQAVAEDRPSPLTTIPNLRFTREYYALRTERLEDGRYVTRRSPAPVTRAQSGQILRCRIVVWTDRPLTHVMIEDPIPSNFRIVDSDVPSFGYSWDEWWSRSVYLDDKAVIFADQVVPGKAWAVEYAVRAEIPGKCAARPAVLSKMYQPDSRASTSAIEFEVTPR